MVERTSLLLVVTICCLCQAIGCSDPAEELCDQPEGGDTDEGGDDGLEMSLEHTDALPPEELGFTSSDPQGRAALVPNQALRARLGPTISSRGLSKGPLAAEAEPPPLTPNARPLARTSAKSFSFKKSALDLGLVVHEEWSMTHDVDAPGVAFRSGAFDDPRVPVTSEAELQSYPLRTVVLVSLSREASDGIEIYKGTGFLAGPRHVITNRHVVQIFGVDLNEWIEEPPMFFNFSVSPGRSKPALLNGGPWAVERVIWNPFPETEHNDYVLLILEDDIERSGRYGRMGLCSASSNTLDGLPIVTAGYPGSKLTCGQTPEPPDADNDCPCGGWMYTQLCEISEVDPQELINTCETQQGQSGSPLWVDECSNGIRCTVGINYGKSRSKSTAVRWRNDDIEWLHNNICQWTSDYATMPPFCD